MGEVDEDVITRYGATVVGPVAAITVAGGLVGWRDSLGVTNVGLTMVLVVLLTSLVGGRVAGIVTAVTAALSFNYFHTQPYQSLAVAAREDVIAVVLLGCVALVAAEVGARSREHRAELRRRMLADDVLDAASQALSGGAPLAAVWPDVERFLLQSGCRSVTLLEAGLTTRPGQPGERTLTVPVRGGAVVAFVSAALPERADELAAVVRRVAGVLAGGPTAPRS